jgi:ssDNA-binding Zn-finger/Zn-ribbon topoisomerase 1
MIIWLIFGIIVSVLIYLLFFTTIFQKNAETKPVVYSEDKHQIAINDRVKYSEFYSAYICPECKHILDHDKARYRSRCCYKCGYSNGSLFSCASVVLRDKFVNGKFQETIVITENDDDE